LALIPRKKYLDKPAIILELKYEQTAEGAIEQIKQRNYPSALEDYHGNMLLVGINYSRRDKLHECLIEAYEK